LSIEQRADCHTVTAATTNRTIAEVTHFPSGQSICNDLELPFDLKTLANIMIEVQTK
jgi:hypothetical protein